MATASPPPPSNMQPSLQVRVAPLPSTPERPNAVDLSQLLSPPAPPIGQSSQSGNNKQLPQEIGRAKDGILASISTLMSQAAHMQQCVSNELNTLDLRSNGIVCSLNDEIDTLRHRCEEAERRASEAEILQKNLEKVENDLSAERLSMENAIKRAVDAAEVAVNTAKQETESRLLSERESLLTELKGLHKDELQKLHESNRLVLAESAKKLAIAQSKRKEEVASLQMKLTEIKEKEKDTETAAVSQLRKQLTAEQRKVSAKDKQHAIEVGKLKEHIKNLENTITSMQKAHQNVVAKHDSTLKHLKSAERVNRDRHDAEMKQNANEFQQLLERVTELEGQLARSQKQSSGMGPDEARLRVLQQANRKEKKKLEETRRNR